MENWRLIAVLCLIFLLGKVDDGFAQSKIPVVKLEELKKEMAETEKEVLVVNFWATWCAPCVKELPNFEKLHQEQKNVKVLLVSLDFADKVEKAEKLIAKKGITAPVVLLDEIDYDSWIDQIDPSWQGAIPATLIVHTKTQKKTFLNKELSYEELLKAITHP